MAQRTFPQKSAAYRLADRIGDESIAAQALRKQTKENQDRLERLGASPPDADYDPEEAQDEVEERRADLNVLLDADDTAQSVQSDLEKNKKIIEKQLNLVNDPETSYSEVENLKAVIQAKRIACREFLHDTRHDASEEENTRFANVPLTVERVEVSANEAELDRLRAKIDQLQDNAALRAELERVRAELERLRAEIERLRQQTGQERSKHDIPNSPETRAVIAWAKSRMAGENQSEIDDPRRKVPRYNKRPVPGGMASPRWASGPGAHILSQQTGTTGFGNIASVLSSAGGAGSRVTSPNITATNPGHILDMALRAHPFNLSPDVEMSNPAVETATNLPVAQHPVVTNAPASSIAATTKPGRSKVTSASDVPPPSTRRESARLRGTPSHAEDIATSSTSPSSRSDLPTSTLRPSTSPTTLENSQDRLQSHFAETHHDYSTLGLSRTPLEVIRSHALKVGDATENIGTYQAVPVGLGSDTLDRLREDLCACMCVSVEGYAKMNQGTKGTPCAYERIRKVGNSDGYLACGHCVTNNRMCIRQVEVNGKLVAFMAPLPPDKRGDATMADLGYWVVRPGDPMAKPPPGMIR